MDIWLEDEEKEVSVEDMSPPKKRQKTGYEMDKSCLRLLGKPTTYKPPPPKAEVKANTTSGGPLKLVKGQLSGLADIGSRKRFGSRS